MLLIIFGLRRKIFFDF
ncbi:hypothetical protein ACFP1L_02455 [Lactiplantibacillus nangangensis]|uniref:Uncharacterized protein n=1 Tax=Lactiplantibacillus nangangensis TaxID=2559917 RepID=A0ABW1SGA1_9LACO